MLTRTFISRLITAAAVVSIVACSTTPQNPQASRKYVEREACVSSSAIPTESAACNSFGRSYSKEDIDHTGATTLAGALALMDPAITIRH